MTGPALLGGEGEPAMAAVWCNDRFLEAACRVEVAWVQAAAEAGLAPSRVFKELQGRIGHLPNGLDRIREATARVGRSIAPLVDFLAEGASEGLLRVLHLGLTTQDVIDAALVLMRDDAWHLCNEILRRLLARLEDMAETHSETLMPARTNGQIAGVTTFGLFLSEAAAELSRGRMRVTTQLVEARGVVMSGAIGLSDPFGEKTTDVRKRAAAVLGVPYDPAATSSVRDRIADLHLALALLAKSLGRIAGTVMDLQSEGIAELSEAAPGSSSAIPNKANPRLAEAVLVHSTQIDSLVQTALKATQTLHHRSGVSWRQEWTASAEIFSSVFSVLCASAEMMERLLVNTDVMVRHVEEKGAGAFADRLLVVLSAQVGRKAARDILDEITLGQCSPAQMLDYLFAQRNVELDKEALRAALSIEDVRRLAEGKQQEILREIDSSRS